MLLRSCRHTLTAPKPRAWMLGGCSVDELRHAATDRERLERYRHELMTGRQCCRHVGTVTAACTAQVSDLRTTLWTSVFGCGVLLKSLSTGYGLKFVHSRVHCLMLGP